MAVLVISACCDYKEELGCRSYQEMLQKINYNMDTLARRWLYNIHAYIHSCMRERDIYIYNCIYIYIYICPFHALALHVDMSTLARRCLTIVHVQIHAHCIITSLHQHSLHVFTSILCILLYLQSCYFNEN